jgi:hypothetical protein
LFIPKAELPMMASDSAYNENIMAEKMHQEHRETVISGVSHDADDGNVATDQYGRPLVDLDRAAEARLRLKIDLYIVPTVALMYLFCFIDRANIGEHGPSIDYSLLACHI